MKVSVIGLGISGFYTAMFLKKRGIDVCVNDIKKENELNKDYVRKIKEVGCEVSFGGYDRKAILKSDMIVISPGVPKDLDILNEARKIGIPVIGEIELAYKFVKSPIIAITGTNGKSTVTSLIGEILKGAGINVFVGGNIGRPFISFLLEDKRYEYIVLEISSFQLDTIKSFSPSISIILNITPDHLDRYRSFDDYVKSKLSLIENQRYGYAILNDEDKILSQVSPKGVRVLRYGIEKKQGRCAFIDGDSIVLCLDNVEKRFPIRDIRLRGEHNLLNLMPAIISSIIIGINRDLIEDAVRRFKGLPHRIEFVFEKDGIAFYDDSKATNIDSSIKAIRSFKEPIILIAGGKDKGLSYFELAKEAKGRVKYAVFIGETADRMKMEFEKEGIRSEIADTMQDAVSKAVSRAEKGDIVLLSPAASSFDMFRDYAHRGDEFKKAVMRIFDEGR